MKTFTLSPRLRNTFAAFILIGFLSFALSLFRDPSRAWHGYLISYYFFMSISLGGCFFAGTQHLTNAGWSATVRRIPEALYSWLPFAIILFVPILIFGKSIYLWTNAEAVSKDHLLQMKTAYLNVPFFCARAVAFFAMWYFVGGQMVRNSLKQDKEGGVLLTQKNVKLAAIFMPLFAILFSLISVDLIMSLDPHWYSTMFGVNCFANLFLSTIAATVIIVVWLKRAGYFGETVNENHIQNLGLLLFAFVIFYAYIVFCQFMLIWYANLPEETSYYIRRWDNGWSTVAYLILIFKFAVPFLYLLPREAKRNRDRLVKAAYLILAISWVEVFWMVMPNSSDHSFFPVLEIGIFLGFLGGFGLCCARFLHRNPIQPQKDPRVQEALHLHQ